MIKMADCSCVATIGLIFIAFYVIKFIWWLYDTVQTFILTKKPMNFKELGQWAVVTGATDGIGKEYAKQIARRGMNVVLISRTMTKLQELAKEIENESKVQVKVIDVDFTGDLDIYPRIKDRLKDLDVGLLINNVGMSYESPQYVSQVDEKTLRDIVIINCMACTMMSHLMLPSMIAKHKGVIVNVSSASGLHPTPLLSVYSATKVYVDFFTRALQVEASGKGVTIQLVMPFFVCTKLSGIKRPTFFIPTPENFVRQALNTIGRQTYTFGCLSHAVQGLFVAALPSTLYGRISFRMMQRVMNKILKRNKNKKN